MNVVTRMTSLSPVVPLESFSVNVGELSDHDLIETMAAARRLASRVQAVELAAVAELARRRFDEADGTRDVVEVLSPADYVFDEVAEALTLTAASADGLIRFATELTGRLPATFAALAAGDIDHPKARTIWQATGQLDEQRTRTVEAEVLPRAAEQTTGQIRAKIRRLVKRLDPGAADRRREEAERRRDVELFETEDGTAQLNAVDLPADAAGAAYGRLNAIATGLKHDGDRRTIGQLRADVFLGLLRGTFTTTEPQADTAGRGVFGVSGGGSGGVAVGEAARRGVFGVGGGGLGGTAGGEVAGRRVLGVGSGGSGEVAGGEAAGRPVPATGGGDPGWTDVDDAIADVIAAAVRAELTALTRGITAPRHQTTETGRTTPQETSIAGAGPLVAQALIAGGSSPVTATGDFPRRHHDIGALVTQAAERIHQSLADLREPWCVPADPSAHGTGRYRPPAAMRRLIQHRDRRCAHPGCRRPVQHCDADHTLAFQRGGPTCPCNLAMLCRRHHRLKATKRWHIEQLWPGVILWITPTGHWKITAPNDRE
jgi:uncharacterized protein DUF222